MHIQALCECFKALDTNTELPKAKIKTQNEQNPSDLHAHSNIPTRAMLISQETDRKW